MSKYVAFMFYGYRRNEQMYKIIEVESDSKENAFKKANEQIEKELDVPFPIIKIEKVGKI